MSSEPTPSIDWINAIFGPVIGFLIGMALGYALQLAAVTTWWIALIYVVILGLAALIILITDHVFDRGFDAILNKVGLGSGIKASSVPHKPHWFNRYGWMIALPLGGLAVFVLPESVLAWL